MHLHTDPHNSGSNYIITFGSYKAGGELFTHEKDGPHSITLPDSQYSLRYHDLQRFQATS